jgi:hypothetical protein
MSRTKSPHAHFVGFTGLSQTRWAAYRRSTIRCGCSSRRAWGIVAGETDRTRPLNAYPKVASYVGRGSIDAAANFAVMTEHFDVATEPNGWRFILLTTQIEDPEYLTSMFLLNMPFRLLPDGAQWTPGPCTAQ